MTSDRITKQVIRVICFVFCLYSPYYLGDQLISTEYENQYYILCNFGQENGDRDGYYLSGIFNYHFGPAYLENYHTRSTTVTTEGTNEYYRFMMQMVTGIRR